MFINGCDLDSIRNQLGHASVLTTLIYIKASPKIHKAKYDAYCPLYKDSQRTPDALIIRQITRDPLNVIASHEPRAVATVAAPATGIIDVQATPILAPAEVQATPILPPTEVPPSDNALASPPSGSQTPDVATAEPAECAKKKSPASRRGAPKKPRLASASATATEETQNSRTHTFQISLFNDDPKKLVLMSEAVDTVFTQPMTISEKAVKLGLARVNKRQKLALVRMHENGEAMTNRLYRNLNQVSRNIARDDLIELCERNILQCDGMGRSVRYWLKAADQVNPTQVVQQQGLSQNP